MAFQFDVPVGGIVIHDLSGQKIRHLGGGRFISEEPVWLIEAAVTPDDSRADEEGLIDYDLTPSEAQALPTRRRIYQGSVVPTA